MSTVKIGSNERAIQDADSQWINEQINRNRDNGVQVCVVVRIIEPEVNLTLTTPSCGGRSGGGRQANEKELAVLDLWSDRGLNQDDFSGGSLVAFLAQLNQLL